METTTHIDNVKNMSASQFKALRRIASNHSQDIQRSIDCICKEVRDIWKECSHIDLPSHAQLVVVYTGSDGESFVDPANITLRDDEGFPITSPDCHAPKMVLRGLRRPGLVTRLRYLVEHLVVIAGFKHWKEGTGSWGTFSINLDNGAIEDFIHKVRTIQFETTYIDMMGLLGTESGVQ